MVLLLRCVMSNAATYDSDGTVQNIQSIHDYQAHDGDTITLPSGTVSWNAALNITKGITLKGQTTVTGNAMDPTGFTVTDNTVVLDDTPRTSPYGLKVTITPSQKFECLGITFRGSTTTPTNGSANNMFIVLETATTATNALTRIHHCHFDTLYRRCIGSNGANYGVADHNQVSIRGSRLYLHRPGWFEWRSAGLRCLERLRLVWN